MHRCSPPLLGPKPCILLPPAPLDHLPLPLPLQPHWRIHHANPSPPHPPASQDGVRQHIETLLPITPLRRNTKSTFSCVDGRSEIPVLATPGGDFAELAAGIATYLKLNKIASDTPAGIAATKAIFKAFMDQVRPRRCSARWQRPPGSARMQALRPLHPSGLAALPCVNTEGCCCSPQKLAEEILLAATPDPLPPPPPCAADHHPRPPLLLPHQR